MSATIAVPNRAATGSAANRKNIIIKNCASSTNCINETNTQIDNAKRIDRVTNIVIIILKHLEVYGTNIEMNNF